MRETKETKVCEELPVSTDYESVISAENATLEGEDTSGIDKTSFLEIDITFFYSCRNSHRCVAAFICVNFTPSHNYL